MAMIASKPAASTADMIAWLCLWEDSICLRSVTLTTSTVQPATDRAWITGAKCGESQTVYEGQDMSELNAVSMASASDSGLNGFSMKPKGWAASARLRIMGSPWALTNRLGMSKRCLISMAAATPSLLFASRMSLRPRLAGRLDFLLCRGRGAAHLMAHLQPHPLHVKRRPKLVVDNQIFCLADKDARGPRSER